MHWRCGFFLLLLGLPYRSPAIVLFGTADPDAHTTSPAAPLEHSGWEFETGSYGSGTIVGPAHVLTAAHLNLGPGSKIDWGGLNYTVLDVIPRANTDLALLRVAGKFPTWAKIYVGTEEPGKAVVLHGRGGPRGNPVNALDDSGQAGLRGWAWTPPDGRLRWGTNVVSGIANENPAGQWEFLAALFSNQAGDDEATISLGDSGGGVFLHDSDGEWKLAGVLASVQSTFKRSAEEPPFEASLFDRRGFLEQNENLEWQFDPSATEQPETLWFASRISTHASWLQTQIEAPLANSGPILRWTANAAEPWVPHTFYAIDPIARRITVPDTASTGFFQLEGEPLLRVVGHHHQVIELAY